jgi:hypothetical protein
MSRQRCQSGRVSNEPDSSVTPSQRFVAKLTASLCISGTWIAGIHYRSIAWLIAATLISHAALLRGSGKLIDAWCELTADARERRRRRTEKTERWHVTLGRGFETTVYVPIGPHGSGEGAIELAKTLADAQGIYWTGEGFEQAGGNGWGASRYISRAEGGTIVSETKERIVEWIASR